MKKYLLSLAAVLALTVGLGLSACSNSEKPAEATGTEANDSTATSGTDGDQAHAHYACPMDCEHGKVYEEPGKCPVCGMDLVEVKTEG